MRTRIWKRVITIAWNEVKTPLLTLLRTGFIFLYYLGLVALQIYFFDKVIDIRQYHDVFLLAAIVFILSSPVVLAFVAIEIKQWYKQAVNEIKEENKILSDQLTKDYK